MNKLISMILTVLILLPCFSTVLFAQKNDESEKLWKEKQAYDAQLFEDGAVADEDSFFDDTYYGYVERAILLLYTDAASEFTFSRSYAYAEGEPIEGIFPIAPILTFGNPENACTWIHCDQIEEILKPYYDNYPFLCGDRSGVPYLRVLVKAFDISKEELYAAREKWFDDPLFIIDQIPLTKEEAELYEEKQRAYPATKDKLIPDFMIEALYLEDEAQACQLLLHPWCLLTDRGPITPYDLGWAEDQADEEVWTSLNVLSEKDQFETFAGYCRFYLGDAENPKYTEDTERIRNGYKLLAMLEKKQSDPPKAGDSTAVYALIFTLSALPLAGLCVYGRKKRRAGF